MSTRYFWIYLDSNGNPAAYGEHGDSLGGPELKRWVESEKRRGKYCGLEFWHVNDCALPEGGNLNHSASQVYGYIKKNPTAFRFYRETFYYPEEELNKIKERECRDSPMPPRMITRLDSIRWLGSYIEKKKPEAEKKTKPTYQELEAELKRLYTILGQAQSKKLDL